MKRYLLIFLLLPLYSYAGDINCGGTITITMNYPEKCSDNIAFKTTGSGEYWLCPASEKGDSMVLTALAAGKSIGVYINSQNDALTCSTLPHYTKARYIALYP